MGSEVDQVHECGFSGYSPTNKAGPRVAKVTGVVRQQHKNRLKWAKQDIEMKYIYPLFDIKLHQPASFRIASLQQGHGAGSGTTDFFFKLRDTTHVYHHYYYFLKVRIFIIIIIITTTINCISPMHLKKVVNKHLTKL